MSCISNTNKIKKWIYAFTVFLIFYLILFIQYPLNKSTGGICDTWLGISIYNSFHNLLTSMLTGSEFTTSLYPSQNIFMYGETVFGFSGFFILFKMVGLNDIYSYYLLIVIIFSLNALAMYFIAYYYTNNFFASLISGFLFSCSNFIFANFDDIAVFCYALPLFSVFLLHKFVDKQNKKYLYISILLIAVQIYFSLYVFVYGLILYMVFILFGGLKNLKTINIRLKDVLLCLLVFLITILPFISFYLYSKVACDLYLPSLPSWVSVTPDTYLRYSDFLKVLPNNLIYHSDFQEYRDMLWFALPRRSAFIGFIFILISVFSICKFYKKFYLWLIVGILGLLLSLSGFNIFNIGIKAPYEYASNFIPVLKAIRVPLRAFMLTIISFSIFSAIGLAFIFDKIKKKGKIIFICVIVLFFHFAENIPFPLPLSKIKLCNAELLKEQNIKLNENFSASLLIPDKDLITAITNTKKAALILSLPSKYIFGESDAGLLTWSREILYMNHQTYFKRNVFNGVNGYYPKSRVIIQQYIDQLPDEKALLKLKENGLTHIIFYKYLIINPEEDIVSWLKTTNRLVLIRETDNFALFKLI